MIDRAYTEQLLARLPVIERELSDPAIAANQKKYKELVREHYSLRKLRERADKYFNLIDSLQENQKLAASEDVDAELKELARDEINELTKKAEIANKELVIALLPPDPDGEKNAIMEIRAGTGGSEAAIFAGDLYRMYNRYAESRGWKTRVIDAGTSEMGGYKEIVLTVSGSNVYSVLQYESGVHRVQRVPVTESQGRIHTSAATVAVFPEVEDDNDIEIDPGELRVDIYCSSGPGGQGVNTTYSAVRITHLPTGLVAQSQDERSQHRNKDIAMRVLKARILDQRKREEDERKGNIRRSQIGSGDRSERIRTYNFPQNRLTDHRINLTLYSLNTLIEGEIDELLTALRDHDIKLRLEKELAGKTDGN
ncbi:MAG: peptide chain release factor 1 [Lentisphaerae bacterium]|nr:peptide chain release factor 1 [Lentisphaerota bacterium]